MSVVPSKSLCSYNRTQRLSTPINELKSKQMPDNKRFTDNYQLSIINYYGSRPQKLPICSIANA